VVLGLPFALVPILISRILFAALTAAVGVWAILRYRPHAWPLLLSALFTYSPRISAIGARWRSV
jgi:hypothetical protein